MLFCSLEESKKLIFYYKDNANKKRTRYLIKIRFLNFAANSYFAGVNLVKASSSKAFQVAPVMPST